MYSLSVFEWTDMIDHIAFSKTHMQAVSARICETASSGRLNHVSRDNNMTPLNE